MTVADRSLAEVAERTGLGIETLRKHVQRNKLRATRGDDGKYSVKDADLELYMAGDLFASMTAAAHDAAKPAPEAVRELGNIFGQVPTNILNAILSGIPHSSNKGTSPGNPAAFLAATKGMPPGPPVIEDSEDPHFGHPIGYAHEVSPRWKRISESTWELDKARWSFNGFGWEGSGSADGRELAEGISPAAPASDRRPLAPSKAVPR